MSIVGLDRTSQPVVTVSEETETTADAPAKRSTFLIADDHPMVRDALALGAGPGLRRRGSRDGRQPGAGRRRRWSAQPETDALLLDLDMPGMDGLTGLALLRSDHPTVPIIVVSAARERAVIRRAYEFGASAYIDKSASLEEIADTVRAVLDGEIFAPPEATPADSFAQRAAQLTPQQWRVLALMVQGDQNKQIAYKLGVGEATVKAHVTVILRKLGVRSRTQAVIEARGPRAARRPGAGQAVTLRVRPPSRPAAARRACAAGRAARRASPACAAARPGAPGRARAASDRGRR